jgi:hypothetical protein
MLEAFGLRNWVWIPFHEFTCAACGPVDTHFFVATLMTPAQQTR